MPKATSNKSAVEQIEKLHRKAAKTGEHYTETFVLEDPVEFMFAHDELIHRNLETGPVADTANKTLEVTVSPPPPLRKTLY